MAAAPPTGGAQLALLCHGPCSLDTRSRHAVTERDRTRKAPQRFIASAPLPIRTLTFMTTSGNLSEASGVTDANGQVSLTISGISAAVVSASFGGWISSQGWAYQPTMARITVTAG